MTVVDSDGRGLAARLWEANRDLAMVALGDRFVRGLADGSLPAESFKAYVAQDAFFLEAFARAYALALARSPDRHGLETFHTLITGVLDELRLHASYALGGGPDTRRAGPGHPGLHRFPAGNGQPRLRRREVRGVDVLRMFRNLAPSHSGQGLARIGRLVEALH